MKVKINLEEAMQAQRESRGMALRKITSCITWNNFSLKALVIEIDICVAF
jgi:hypothetical protein